jgi:hypothetical protein
MIGQFNFIGQGGSYWFIGVVEAVLDPENMGRVKVRCFGIHTEDKTALPTDALPWALVGTSPNGNSSDIGHLLLGTVVYGIFLDGIDMQMPLVQLVIPGLHVSTNTDKGFSNLKPTPPTTKTHTGNAFARAKDYPKRTYYPTMEGANGKSFTEPQNTQQPKYPYNNATQSDSGQLFEMDDTPNHERLSLQDRYGNYFEFHGKNAVLKTIEGLYNLCKNYYLGIANDRVTAIGGGDYEKIHGGNKVIEIANGDYILNCKNANITINGDVTLNVTGNVNETVNGNHTLSVSGNSTIEAGGTLSLNGSVILIG